MPMNTERIAREVNTTKVEPTSSSLVAHDTLVNSSFTSFRYAINLFAMNPVYRFSVGVDSPMAGAEGIEPPVTVLETVGLPLTDAPRPDFK